MLNEKTIAVVVPCYNEEQQIVRVLETMPDFVDRIVVINDGSTDKTEEVVKGIISKSPKSDLFLPQIPPPPKDGNPYTIADRILYDRQLEELKFYPKSMIFNDSDNERIVLINQENSKKGRALSTGYLWCRNRVIDCIVTMDGDGQMDSNDLESIVSPIIYDGIDFVKTNRLGHPSAPYVIPKKRYFGNSVLSLMTKIASGYWRVSDSQTGFIALSRRAIASIQLHRIYKNYGCPNDLMVKLNIANCTIREVIVRPVYNVGEVSKMKISRDAPGIFFMLVKNFFKRLSQKYFKKSFHPLFLFYLIAILFLTLSFGLFVYLLVQLIRPDVVVSAAAWQYFIISIIVMLQSAGFAMFMDIQDNSELYK